MLLLKAGNLTTSVIYGDNIHSNKEHDGKTPSEYRSSNMLILRHYQARVSCCLWQEIRKWYVKTLLVVWRECQRTKTNVVYANDGQRLHWYKRLQTPAREARFNSRGGSGKRRRTRSGQD